MVGGYLKVGKQISGLHTVVSTTNYLTINLVDSIVTKKRLAEEYRIDDTEIISVSFDTFRYKDRVCGYIILS